MDTYGRVTDPDRYRVLHRAAGELLDRLAREFVVERVDDGDPDGDTVVRLSPSVGDGAPLTVEFTAFPGLVVRFGRRHVDAYPRCGCDACDEQPDDLVAELREQVEILVTGGFSESLVRGPEAWITHRFAGRSGGRRLVDGDEAATLGEADHWDWPPWTRRGD